MIVLHELMIGQHYLANNCQNSGERRSRSYRCGNRDDAVVAVWGC